MKLKLYLLNGGRGCARDLAEKIGVSPSYLSQMASGQTSISPKRCVQIEIATEGLVTREDLHPNWYEIWPELLADGSYTKNKKNITCTQVQDWEG